MGRLQVECRVKVATQVIERVQVGQPGAVVTHEVRTFLVVAVDAPYLVYQVASLRLAAYRTVHLDVVYLAVVDEPVTDSGFDRLEELDFLHFVTESIVRDEGFQLHLGSGRFSGLIAVKPSGFRLTKTQLAVRRSGPCFSNNYCVSDHCVAIFLWFVGLFHQIFAGCSPH